MKARSDVQRWWQAHQKLNERVGVGAAQARDEQVDASRSQAEMPPAAADGRLVALGKLQTALEQGQDVFGRELRVAR